MVKIPRNNPCPCGSGKKYKRCCGAVDSSRPSTKDIVATVIDHDANEVAFFTKDMLTNQLKHTSPEIASSFDRLHGKDLDSLSEFMARPMALLSLGYKHALRTDDELRVILVNLVFNALHSFIAAASLLRQGFYLQCSMLIRFVIEQTATVLYLATTPNDLDKLKRGDLKLPAILRGAKKVLPVFAGLYGFFSEHFVHMSQMHAMAHPLVPYKEYSDELDVNIGFLRTAAWLILVTTELLFIDLHDDRLYWKPRGRGQVTYNPSEETKQWQEKFLSLPSHENDPGAV